MVIYSVAILLTALEVFLIDAPFAIFKNPDFGARVIDSTPWPD
jgi:hypothetical protein